MPYKPVEIANTFLAKFSKEQNGISHMKLQKLVYCVHGWWLAYYDDSLLSERPEVWKYGPVFPSLYREFKVYGTNPINEAVKPSPFDDVAPVVKNTDDETQKLIEWVWKRYGHLSAMALSDMTHKEGTAWRKVAEERNFRVPMGLSLSDKDVQEEFVNLKKEFEVHIQ